MTIWSLKCLKMIPHRNSQTNDVEINSKNKRGALPCRVTLTIIIRAHLLTVSYRAAMVNPHKDNSHKKDNRMDEASPTTLQKTIFNLNKISTTMIKIAILEIVQIRIANMLGRGSLQSIKTTEWARRTSIFIIPRELNIYFPQSNQQASLVTQYSRGTRASISMLFSSKEVDLIIILIWLMLIFRAKVPNL